MARTRAKRIQAEKHKEWINKWRENPENMNAELKARVLNRVKKGAVPNVVLWLNTASR